VTSGFDWKLEEIADEILTDDRRRHRETDKSPGAVFGILLPDQLKLRVEREVLTEDMDQMRRPGMYSRAWSARRFDYRPTNATRFAEASDPWRQFLHEEYGLSDGVLGNWVPLSYRPEVTSGMSYEDITPRDPAWPVLPREGRFHHLDRYQRSRIRSAMRKIPPTRQGARRVLTLLLAQKYGVPWWVITRLAYRDAIVE
jgi:hypothetical protein